MALIRPGDTRCRWDYIYITDEVKLHVAGLGEFTISDFLDIVRAYKEDFPADIKDRLNKELRLLIDR